MAQTWQTEFQARLFWDCIKQSGVKKHELWNYVNVVADWLLVVIGRQPCAFSPQ